MEWGGILEGRESGKEEGMGGVVGVHEGN